MPGAISRWLRGEETPSDDDDEWDIDRLYLNSGLDDETLMHIETLVTKFDVLDVNGPALYEFKKDSQKMDIFRQFFVAKCESLGFWLILSKAINSLKMPRFDPFDQDESDKKADNV